MPDPVTVGRGVVSTAGSGSGTGGSALVKKDPISEMVNSRTVPPIAKEHFNDAEWAAMSTDDRLSAVTFFLAEQGETTRGLEITFPRIPYPTSQAAVWQIPDVSGTPQFKPVIAGVPIFKQGVRAYWPIGDPVSNNPPTCSSPDGKKPDTPGPISQTGRQSDSCLNCQQAAFGTGRNGRGQACKSRINVFTLLDMSPRPADINAPLDLEEIPTLISIPPSQLRAFSEYAVAVRKNVPSGSLLSHTTVFGLKDDKNSEGVEYKALNLSTGKRLTYEQMVHARDVANAFEDQFMKRGFVPDDVEEKQDDSVPF